MARSLALALPLVAVALAAAQAPSWRPLSNFGSHPSVLQDRQRTLDERFGNLDGFGQYESSLGGQPDEDGCSLYKVGMSQDQSNQYVQYKDSLPDMKEFTLCMWTRFSNHSSDHPLFSYAVGDHPREISSWVSNTKRASYFSLAVAGHTFYRLNYPLKLNKWYHSCQSWNGRTGEWQIWVKGERVGRGFHNRLVGHAIKGGGVAITGQEQGQLGSLPDGREPKATNGMMGEVTMLQLYHVALTAGKAHKDHKHHHVHHFGHDGAPLPQTPVPAPLPPPPPGSTSSLLVGGQINPIRQLNLGNPTQLVPSQLPNGLQLNQQYVNGQFGPGRSISEQLYNAQPSSNLVIPNQIQFPSSSSGSRVVVRHPSAPADVQYLDSYSHNLFKRSDTNKRNKRDDPKRDLLTDETLSEQGESKKQIKRGLVALSDGSIVDDSLLESDGFSQSLLSGLAGLGENIPVQTIQKEKVDEREPAEAEVRAVMEICNGCSDEPFQKALVLSWRHSPKKLYSGAVYYPAVPACEAF